MAFSNATMAEYQVPKTPGVDRRLHGFFNEIGWHTRLDTDEPGFVYVQPMESTGIVAYWNTTTERKLAKFVINKTDDPSPYRRGIGLPDLDDLVEVSFVLPSDELVHELWVKGGSLLEAHAHIKLHSHSGAEEFRFSDPFNYSLRVTADPGYQLK